MTRLGPAATVLIATLLLVVTPGEAQLRRRDRPERHGGPGLSLLLGPTKYDLSGTGTTGIGELRLDNPIGQVFVIDFGLGVFRYESQFNQKITHLLTEVSLQAQVPNRAVRPYVGVGGGFAEYLSGRGATYGILHVAVGLRADLSEGWGVEGEARARSIDPFTGHTLDLVFGVRKRFR